MNMQTIELSGKRYEVSLTQQPKSLWIATGEYKGEQLEARGVSGLSAIALWRMAARFVDESPAPANREPIPKFLDAA